MKKKIPLLLIAAVIIFTSCNSSNITSEKQMEKSQDEVVKEKNLDLTGNWEQSNKNSEDSFQAGYIKDGVIELYWISDGGATKSLYWSGTYEAPTGATEEYMWNSQNNTEKTSSALLASDDETKTFIYKDGELSYSASALGTTITVKMKRTDINYE